MIDFKIYTYNEYYLINLVTEYKRKVLDFYATLRLLVCTYYSIKKKVRHPGITYIGPCA